MLGSIIGDIAGSRFEFHNYRSKDFVSFTKDCFLTDDSVLTLAIAKAIMECRGKPFAETRLNEAAIKYMQELGRSYPDCGFSCMFAKWLFSKNPQPYCSSDNGAAKRVSPCGFIAQTEEEAKQLSKSVTEVTHNHPEGLKGAEATTIAIFMARTGATKREIHERIEKDYYSLDFTLDDIRDTYQFTETCQETVPQAIVAFLEAITFEDAIHNAVSIGGDSDTIASITGAIAEAFFGIPDLIKQQAITYLDCELCSIYNEWEKFLDKKTLRKFDSLTKYANKLETADDRQNFHHEFSIFCFRNLNKFVFEEYSEILTKNGLKWSEISLKSANVEDLDDEGILACILAVVRAGHIIEGVFDRFVDEGYITKWLNRLKEIDDNQ
jgi:ADP-ribosylglycohydrolase